MKLYSLVLVAAIATVPIIPQPITQEESCKVVGSAVRGFIQDRDEGRSLGDIFVTIQHLDIPPDVKDGLIGLAHEIYEEPDLTLQDADKLEKELCNGD